MQHVKKNNIEHKYTIILHHLLKLIFIFTWPFRMTLCSTWNVLYCSIHCDTVAFPIQKFDRSNLCPRNLKCIVLEKGSNGQLTLQCQTDIIDGKIHEDQVEIHVSLKTHEHLTLVPLQLVGP